MFRIFGILLCAFLSKQLKADEVTIDVDSIFQTVAEDYKNFYTQETAMRAGVMFSAGAVMAHTPIDTEFQYFYQNNIHSALTDDVAGIAKLFGEKVLLIPASALAASWQIKDSDSELAKWGQLALRSYIVGAPVIGVTQPLTGGSRPRDEYQNAYWRPFNDDNGVSGHSFVGAVPFLVLSKMDSLTEEQKNMALFASGLSAWSRINDNAHYLSQAILGWYVAWESVNAVTKSSLNNDWYSITPKIFGDGVGLNISVNW